MKQRPGGVGQLTGPAANDVVETQACPACGADIFEDAERCPECGQYVVDSESAISAWPWWLFALGLAGTVAVILAWSLGS